MPDACAGRPTPSCIWDTARPSCVAQPLLAPPDLAVESRGQVVSTTIASVEPPKTQYATELFAAVGAGDFDEVKRLLATGADVNAHDKFGATPLELSVNGLYHPDEADPIVQALIEGGAELDATTTPDFSEGSGGCTALMQAAHEGHTSQVKLLLAAGADPNVVSTAGWTALTFATHAGAGAPEKLLVLLEAGADFSVRDRDGKTALDWARERLDLFASPSYADAATKVVEEMVGTEADVAEIFDEIGSKVPPGIVDRVQALHRSGPSVSNQTTKAREVVKLLERAASRS